MQGGNLGEMISKRVAALVMIMVIAMPFAMYEELDRSLAISLQQFDSMVAGGQALSTSGARNFFDFYDESLVRPQSLVVDGQRFVCCAVTSGCSPGSAPLHD